MIPAACVFRRCAADRRLSGVEQNFAACCSQKGKCVKAQYFAIFHDRGPGTKRVVTTTPCSLDATPGSTFAAARRTNPTSDALSLAEHRGLNPETAKWPCFSCLTRPRSRLLVLQEGVGAILPSWYSGDARRTGD